MTVRLARAKRSASPLLALIPPVGGLILDVDGVLWKDSDPIGDLAAIFQAIRDAGWRVAIATNNAMHTVQDYVLKLERHGIRIDADAIVTSAEGTSDVLAAAFPDGGAIFLAGEVGVQRALSERGFDVVTDPDAKTEFVAVVAGIDRDFSYARLQKASTLIRSGVAYYGTNPDLTYPTAHGLWPGAGAILASITAAAGKEPIIIGKPSPLLFEIAARRIGVSASEVVVVGDRLETDIQGGQAFGARTALVLSGVSTRAQAESWKPPPTLVATDLAALVGI